MIDWTEVKDDLRRVRARLHQFMEPAELEALDQAIGKVGQIGGDRKLGFVSIDLAVPQLVELLDLLHDEPGPADETILDEIEKKAQAALRGALALEVVHGG